MSGRLVKGLGAPLIELFFLAFLMVPGGAAGQVSVEVRGSTLFESYNFSQSLDSSVDHVSELSLPLAVSAQIGRRTALTVATGYTRVSLSDQGQRPSFVSGLRDTELRLAYQVIPDRVSVFGTSSLPTGKSSLGQGNLPTLGVIASDVIGFSSTGLGGGGAAGIGFAVSEQVGRMALGLATSFTMNGTYRPVRKQPGEFRPGEQFRMRLGLEGPVARRSLLQGSVIFIHRGEDEISGAPKPSVGNTFSGSLAVNQGLGAATLTVYVFDLFRSSAGLAQTPVGTTFLNRGNLFAVGAQWSYPLRSGTSLTPRFEIRDSREQTAGPGRGLRKVGRTTRLGVDVRHRITQRYAIVFRGGGLTGNVVDNAGTDIDVSGYRVSLQLEVLQLDVLR
jgi:hypothetical protein